VGEDVREGRGSEGEGGEEEVTDYGREHCV
jgi:hypothetical protein